MSIADRIRVEDVKVLSDDWYLLKKTTFAYRRGDGTWQTQSRETYDRGNGATILLDNAGPEERIRAETEEETGYRVRDVRKVFEAYMSPGSVTEKLHFFVGRYSPADRTAAGGGNAHEGEDIDVLEVGIDEAMRMIASGEIRDGKTIMLLQHAAMHVFAS